MSLKIALAGNPNAGKTTLFNALTGSNQYVGNWPGVTVEKKEGKLKGRDDVIVTDLPGIYSLSPYTPEEVVARNYLVGERPDVILNIIDGTNIERNLYLTTQLVELGIPVVCAINMIDIVRKNGDEIYVDEISKKMGCNVVEISALKGTGVQESADIAIKTAESNTKTIPQHLFCGAVEHALAHIEEAVLHDIPEEQQRWFSIKIFERDEKVIEQLQLDEKTMSHIEKDIAAAEKEMDDDAESIIVNERYNYIDRIIKNCVKKKNADGLTVSDQIDRVVTSRWFGLPVFALIMFLVYYVSMVTVGTRATDWANEGLFGEGWHLFGIGTSAYETDYDEYSKASVIVDGYEAYTAEYGSAPTGDFTYETENPDTLETETFTASHEDYINALGVKEKFTEEPVPSAYGIWVRGVPVAVRDFLEKINCAQWLRKLVVDGIISGVGSILGFVPQMFVLFLMLAFLEMCGYMSRIAFVLDRLFRRFGLSGKSFIPILVGTGCGVPGIMASRTIENERDRRMTIMTTTFIPCGAKVPFISMIAGALFGGSALISTGAYFIGITAIVISGLILKKTKLFDGEDSPFVMELPAYHMPAFKNVMRTAWERSWEFIKKAGTIILLFTVVIWFLSNFGIADGKFTMLNETQMSKSILAAVGGAICWIFKPLGWGNWQSAVAALTGLAAKENIVGTLGVLYGGGEQSVYSALGEAFTKVSGMSFLVFNLLCAPCFAAMGAIRREMNSRKWFWTAIGYECGFAYIVALMINGFGNFFCGTLEGGFGAVIFAVSIALLCGMLYLIFRHDPNKKKNGD